MIPVAFTRKGCTAMAQTSTAKRESVVLNDAAVVRGAVHALLAEAGYRLHSRPLCASTEASLSESLQQLVNDRPDLIVLDLPMFAERRGWQLLEALKLHRATHHLPVLISTASAGLVADLSAHLTCMAVGVVLKPVDSGQLLTTVAHVLSQADTVTEKRTAA